MRRRRKLAEVGCTMSMRNFAPTNTSVIRLLVFRHTTINWEIAAPENVASKQVALVVNTLLSQVDLSNRFGAIAGDKRQVVVSS
jgi:hypothetical protein